jgi:hypothetical protein
MKQKAAVIVLIAVIVAAAWLILFAPPERRFMIVPSIGLYKRNRQGTYDRYIIWPLGRCVDDPTLCKSL